MDIVTSRSENLHNACMSLLQAPADALMSRDKPPYAVSYRPVVRERRLEIDLWLKNFSIGDELPVLPLRLKGDTFVTIDFEATYMEACRHRRIG